MIDLLRHFLPHFLFIYMYNFVFMINIHRRNTQNVYRTYHTYAGINIFIDSHEYRYILQYLLQLYFRHPEYTYITSPPPIETFYLSFRQYILILIAIYNKLKQKHIWYDWTWTMDHIIDLPIPHPQLFLHIKIVLYSW